MKKVISFLVMVAALAQVSYAANYESLSFMNVQAFQVTNTINVTNLSALGSVGTNVANTLYTNGGSRVVVSAAGLGAGTTLIKDINLWARADGSPAASIVSGTNSGNTVTIGDATFSTTLTGGSGANAAVTFTIAPVWDGVNEATASGDIWEFSFTATASSTITVSTNVPLQRFPGAKKLKLLRVVNADTDASSGVMVRAASINAFVP